MDHHLPTTRAEMRRLGWDRLDVLLLSGDALVDHPAFGTALLGRWLVHHGFRVGVVAQPRWDRPEDVARLGAPRLLVGVSAGAIDSMLAHYTAFRKKRSDDAYTPGGRAGSRPNRAALVYANLVHRALPGTPLLLGGIEASLRRCSHFDFWSDRLRRSLLLDSKADLLIYGMAERPLLQVVRRLDALERAGAELRGEALAGALRGIPGTARAASRVELPDGAAAEELPSHEAVLADPRLLMAATLAVEDQVHRGEGWLLQRSGGRVVHLAPPAAPLDTDELDLLHGLPFSRQVHPSHRGEVPGLQPVKFSLVTHRGCGGGCSFCSLALHQGRTIRSRSAGSLVAEVRRLGRDPAWRGVLSDVGGPSANMWGARCGRDPAEPCRRKSCLSPRPCAHFEVQDRALAALLRRLEREGGLRQLRVASGVRHDLALTQPCYLEALVRRHTGGQLKVAPEHCQPRVLRLMRKSDFAGFERFVEQFERHSAAAGRRQFLVPYLLSAFPGCTDSDMEALARWLRGRGWRPQQVQCFVPTPGTVATAMYWGGIDERGRPIPVARTDAERLRQHRILVDQSPPRWNHPRPPARRKGRRRRDPRR